jgi:hypothetical protein
MSKEAITNVMFLMTSNSSYYCDCIIPDESNTSATHCGRCNKPILKIN